MVDIVVHPRTQAEIDAFLAATPHATLITGPMGIGKGSIVRLLATQLAHVDQDTLPSYPYMRIIGNNTEKTISIEAIRELEHFLSLRVPGNQHRIVIIENAQALTPEAQNALLKTLEEPPTQTTLLLTAPSEQVLLPTVRSRLTVLHVQRPTLNTLTEHFMQSGFSVEAVTRTTLMSGGLPGLMNALLNDTNDHPLVKAAQTARDILQKPSFERLCMVDMLAKDKDYTLHVLNMLQQMAHISLAGSSPTNTWQHILAKSYAATEQLLYNAQPKLVLTNLMLNL